MAAQFDGRHALVTGGASGIGLAIAQALAGAGARVTVIDRDSDGAERAAAAIGGEALVLDLADVDALASVALDADILVNNAGVQTIAPIEEFDPAVFRRMIDLMVTAPFLLTRAVLPGMYARGWGRVVFISSESGLNIPKEMIDYGVTKTAVLAVSRGLAELVAGSGVTVNAVLPGPTDSEILSNWMKSVAQEQGITPAQAEQNFLKAMRPTTLIQRFATTQEVANMVVYVASEQASATTGAALRVDGGVLRSIC